MQRLVWAFALRFKVYGYIFRGSNSVIYNFPSLLKRGLLSKERICSHRSKFFPLRVDPFLGRLRPAGKQTGSHENCLPLKTWRKKMEVYSYTLRQVFSRGQFVSYYIKGMSHAIMITFCPKNVPYKNFDRNFIIRKINILS